MSYLQIAWDKIDHQDEGPVFYGGFTHVYNVPIKSVDVGSLSYSARP